MDWDEVCFVGDDVVDLGPLARAGFGVAVADARPEVKAAADFVTRAAGGRGAVREVVEMILQAQEKWDADRGALFRNESERQNIARASVLSLAARCLVSVAARSGGRSAGRQTAVAARERFHLRWNTTPRRIQQQMKSRLSGAEAQPEPGGLLVIKQLKLETFNPNGKPECRRESAGMHL